MNQQRHVQILTRCDGHFRAEQLAYMPDIVRRAEPLVERPGPAQLHRDTCELRLFISANAYKRNRARLDTFENISGDGAFHKRFSEDQPDRIQEILEIALGEGFCRCLSRITLREMKGHLLRGEP